MPASSNSSTSCQRFGWREPGALLCASSSIRIRAGRRARAASRSNSATSRPRWLIRRGGCVASPASSAAVSLRPWVSTTPIRISSPCARSRCASVSMANVFPTPAQAPKKIFSLPRWASAVCSSSLSGSGRMGSSVI